MVQRKGVRAKRRKVFRDNEAYGQMLVRMMRGYANRVALFGDEADIHRLGELRQVLDEVTTLAVRELRRQRFSWQTIADGLGITRQAAQQRWGGTAAPKAAQHRHHAKRQEAKTR